MNLKSLAGQQSLFADIDVRPPPVVHCRGCSRPIYRDKSLERGYGPGCWVRHLEKIVRNEPETPAEQAPKRQRRRRNQTTEAAT